MKLYNYKASKLFPSPILPNDFSDIEKAEERIKWWFESNRSDKTMQFVIADDTKIIKLIDYENISK